MKIEDWIPTEDLCTHYRVERQFIKDLRDNDIIEIRRIERRECIPLEQISEFERMRRLHYDMHINVEGLEVVRNLLEKIEALQREKRQLLNRLNLYE